MADSFTDLVEGLLRECGITRRGLARLLPYDPGGLSKIISGKRRCPPRLARLIDDALGAGGEVIQAAAQPASAPALLVTEDYVPAELADYFASQLAGHYAADRFLGPGSLIPVALAQHELLCEVAGTTH